LQYYATGIAVTVGLTLAVVGLLVAVYLGVFGYHFRRTTLHEGRLQGMLNQEPTLYQVVVGLREKAPLVASPEGEEELERWLSKWGDQRKEEILEKARRWPITRIFEAGDMIYFIYFDEGKVMRDFVYISTPGYKVQ
jgi:hypothetical protein